MDMLPGVSAIAILAALAPSCASEQLVEALRGDPRFALVGHCDAPDILARDLACLDPPPALVVLDAALCPEPATEVRNLVRRFAPRIVAVSFRDGDTQAIEAMLANGAVHGQSLPVDSSGRVEPRRVQRLLHLLSLLADVRGLEPARPRTPGVRRRDTDPSLPAPEPHSAAAALAAAQAAGHDEPWTTTTNATGQAAGMTAEPSFTSDPTATRLHRPGLAHFQLIGIVSSTGGLTALETVLAALPHDFPLPLAVVQHLAAGTEAEFVRLLGSRCALNVSLVERPVRPKAGTVYVAPGGQHIRLDSIGQLVPSDEPRDAPYRPSASVLLASMADALGARCIGVVLTGMGDDGAEGLLRIRQSGGRTLVQDRSTSRIFGMPQAAIALRAAELVLPLHEIARELIRLARVSDRGSTSG